MALKNLFGDTIGAIGHTFGLPEMGISEKLGGRGSAALQTYKQNSAGGQLSPTAGLNQNASDAANRNVASAGDTAPTDGLYGAAGGAAAPTPDLTPYKNEIASRIQGLQNLYSQLYGQVDQNVADQRSQYDQGYNTQQTKLGNDYAAGMGQVGQTFAGRGLSDSSYLGQAQDTTTNNYKSGVDELNQGRDNAYASLGKFATTQKQQLGSGQQGLGQINLAEYTDPNQLIALRGQLDQQISSLQSTSAGLGTNGQYQNALKAATPAATQQASAKIQQQLQTLSQSGASPLAKQQIASGLLKSAGQDPNDPYWSQFWQTVSQPQQPTAG